MDSKTIGKKLREFRYYKGLTISEFSDLLNISEGHLKNIEFGQKNITLEMVITLKDNLCENQKDYKYLLDIINIDYPEEGESVGDNEVKEGSTTYYLDKINLLERLLEEKERTIQILLKGK